jgi:SAM-dependent methyltransferase
MFRFAHLAIGQHRLYQSEILPRMLTGEQTYLDLGCAFAQDVRRLVADGVDSKQCYGLDLRLDFLQLGYELFNDHETLHSHFIEADVFSDSSAIKDLYGKIDIVDASSFFHLFNLEQQKAVARSVIKILRPNKDSLVVGRQVGNQQPDEYPRRDGRGTRYRHDIASWRKMWDEVGSEAGVQFEVEGTLWETETLREEAKRSGEGATGAMMEFSVRRLN